MVVSDVLPKVVFPFESIVASITVQESVTCASSLLSFYLNQGKPRWEDLPSAMRTWILDGNCLMLQFMSPKLLLLSTCYIALWKSTYISLVTLIKAMILKFAGSIENLGTLIASIFDIRMAIFEVLRNTEPVSFKSLLTC